MDAQQAAAAFWPPRVGDYARVRATGALGEVIEVTCRHLGCRYMLNLFRSDAGMPVVVELDDLETVWPEGAQDAEGRPPDDPAPVCRGLARPS